MLIPRARMEIRFIFREIVWIGLYWLRIETRRGSEMTVLTWDALCLWRYSPFWALISLKRRLHSSVLCSSPKVGTEAENL